jgi:methyltransferase (TIGR00027 family)
MNQAEPLIRNISDTACWAAVYRARENERPDALFHDPFARRLAGARGEQIAGGIPFSERHTWSWITRTYLMDQFINDQIADGVDMVVNLAAGLDARPYRLKLPPTLRWVEVDLPDILRYKEEILAAERPVCALERICLDLADVAARRSLFAQLGTQANKTLVVTEGLLIYWTAAQVGQLAQDLTGPASFQCWLLDLASPGLVHMLQQKLGPELGEGGARMQFGPEEGPGFFTSFGWKPVGVRSLLKTAARLKRLSWFMHMLSYLPESRGRQGKRPWAAVCLLARA